MKCIIDAWDRYEAEIRGFLSRQVADARIAEDLLQDTFVKAIMEGAGFCQLDNPRAWLFRVARNHLTDFYRCKRPAMEISEELAEVTEAISAVETLSACLPRALQALPDKDREVITQCDIQALSQAEYARQAGLSLVATKSRIQRARVHLKQKLNNNCQIRFDDSGRVCCYVPCVPSSQACRSN